MNQVDKINYIMTKLQGYAKIPNGLLTDDSVYKAFKKYGLRENEADKPVSEQDKIQIRDILNQKMNEKKCSAMMDGTFGDGWNFFNTNYYGTGKLPSFEWKVYIPIKAEYYGFVVKNIISFLCDNNIVSSGKISGTMRSDSMIVNLANSEDVTKLNEYISKNKSIKACLGEHQPFIPDWDGIGVVHGFDADTSYTERLSKYLIHYVNTCKKQNRFDLITSRAFLESMKDAMNAGKVNKPNEIAQIIEHMDIILNGKSYVEHNEIENINHHLENIIDKKSTYMNVINNNFDSFAGLIAPIDDSIILKIVQLAFEYKKGTERSYLRDVLYKSKYIPKNLEQSELHLEQILKSQFSDNVRTENQNEEYKWVKINTHNMGEISNRFYIAPNPNNLHQLVQKLVETFDSQNIPVRFKYQLTTGMEQCDRIIIYTDEQHKQQVEQAIKIVYDKNSQLFDGCERSIAWIYATNVPNVYSAPETPGEAYSNVFSDVISEAKETFNYLYGITNSNSKISFQGKETEKAIKYMKLIVSSIMLRKGILRLKDGRIISIMDKNVKAHYDYDTGVLTHVNLDYRGFYEVKFEQSPQGKEALLKNFYSVSNISPQKGLSLRYLTLGERKKEVDKALYADYYKYKEEKQSNGRKV